MNGSLGMDSSKNILSFLLLSWFSKNGRHFSWRKAKVSPYEILIAELLLQRTRAERVEPVFKSFIKKFPNPRTIVKVTALEIGGVIKNLGFQKRRLKNITGIARQLVKEYDGKIPEDKEELIKLTGVGEYTANSVLCFAFSRQVPVVDTNVSRILSRVFSLKIRGDPRLDKDLWVIARELLPIGQAKRFNWAMIDLGALICKPKSPLCYKCPIVMACDYVKSQIR